MKELCFFILCFSVYVLQSNGALHVNGCMVATPLCPQEKIQFWLYNRNATSGIQISANNITAAPLIPGVKVKFLIHGLVNGSASVESQSPFKEISPKYLQYGDYNIIAVDWKTYAGQNSTCLQEITNAAITVGNCTAVIIDAICNRTNMASTNIQVIGYSLGSLAASSAGKFSKSQYNRQLPRITLLDPSYNTTYTGTYSVNKTDAMQVDVAHTDTNGVGMADVIGSVDFYLNGGSKQPGCDAKDDQCSEVRAAEFYAESILPQNSTKGFYGYNCSLQSYSNNKCPKVNDEKMFVLWGENLSSNVTGVYVIDTKSSSPYAIGKQQKGGAYKNSAYFLSYFFTFMAVYLFQL